MTWHIRPRAELSSTFFSFLLSDPFSKAGQWVTEHCKDTAGGGGVGGSDLHDSCAHLQFLA